MRQQVKQQLELRQKVDPSVAARWAVLISGRGSNLGGLLDLSETEFDLRLVLSSKHDAYGLLRARRAGVAAEVTPFIAGTERIDWVRLDRRLRLANVSHIFLAGFMKIIPHSFIEKWENRILNLHPSLLPEYPGLNSIQRAYVDGAAMGVTVHEVIKAVDAGAHVCQRRTLDEYKVKAWSLEASEFLLHIDEQRVAKEVVCRWRV